MEDADTYMDTDTHIMVNIRISSIKVQSKQRYLKNKNLYIKKDALLRLWKEHIIVCPKFSSIVMSSMLKSS